MLHRRALVGDSLWGAWPRKPEFGIESRISGTNKVVPLPLKCFCMAWCLTAPFKNGRTWSHRCRDDECRGCDTCRVPQNATKKEARVSKRKARREAKTEAFKAKEEHIEARHNKEATWGLSGGGWRTVDKGNETAVQEENEAATESKTEEKKAHKEIAVRFRSR